MYRPILVTPPAIRPITLNEAKAHLRVDSADDDELIASLIAAATSLLDGWDGILCRCLCQQTWRQEFDIFCANLVYGDEGGALGRYMRLPLFPVISIISVKYDDTDGIEQTVDPVNYELQADDIGARVRFINAYAFPAVSNEYPSVRIDYSAGYADTMDTPALSTAPDALKAAIKLLVGGWYENREAVITGTRAAAIEMPLAVRALIAPFRRLGI